MTVIQFPQSRPVAEPFPAGREPQFEEVEKHIHLHLFTALLFVDLQAFCQEYADSPWIPGFAPVIDVDQEIVDQFEIKQVPCWRWYFAGQQIRELIGTATEDEIKEVDRNAFKIAGGKDLL